MNKQDKELAKFVADMGDSLVKEIHEDMNNGPLGPILQALIQQQQEQQPVNYMIPGLGMDVNSLPLTPSIHTATEPQQPAEMPISFGTPQTKPEEPKEENPESEKKESDPEVMKKIIEFLSKNNKPEDHEQWHPFAKDELKMEPSDAEEIVYKMLGGFLGNGKHKTYTGEYDAAELKKGIEVEKEHFVGADLPAEILDQLAEKIAKDHLAEFDGGKYYTALDKMEKDIKGSKK